LLPVALSERAAYVLQVVIADTAVDECGGQLGQNAAQYRCVVVPVRGVPGTTQQVRLELDVWNLEAGQFLCTAPVTSTLDLVGASGHPAKGGGQAVPASSAGGSDGFVTGVRFQDSGP